MKRQFLFLFFLTFLVLPNLFCQNVGVGTNTPTNKLEVKGTVKIDTIPNVSPNHAILVDSFGVISQYNLFSDGFFAGMAELSLYNERPKVRVTSRTTWTQVTNLSYTNLPGYFPQPVRSGFYRRYFLQIRTADDIAGAGNSPRWSFAVSGAWQGGVYNTNIREHGFTTVQDWGVAHEGYAHLIEIPFNAATGNVSGVNAFYWQIEAKLPVIGGSFIDIHSIHLLALEFPTPSIVPFVQSAGGVTIQPAAKSASSYSQTAASTSTKNAWVSSNVMITVPETGSYLLNCHSRAYALTGGWWKSRVFNQTNNTSFLELFSGSPVHQATTPSVQPSDGTIAGSQLVNLTQGDVLILQYWIQGGSGTVQINGDGNGSVGITLVRVED